MEDAALGRRTAPRDGVHQDVFGVLRGHEPARRTTEILELTQRRDGRSGAEEGIPDVRFHRVSQMPRRPRAGRWPVGADPEGRRRLPDFRRRSAPELAVPRRRLGGGYLPAAAHGGGRHADAGVPRPDRSKGSDPRGAVAPGAVRTLPLPRGPPRRTRPGPIPPDPP